MSKFSADTIRKAIHEKSIKIHEEFQRYIEKIDDALAKIADGSINEHSVLISYPSNEDVYKLIDDHYSQLDFTVEVSNVQQKPYISISW